MKNSIEIQISKSKLFKLLVSSILFLLCGLWIIIYQPISGNVIFDNIFIKNIAAFIAVLMGIFGIYFLSRKIFDNTPGLIIDNKSIINNTSALSIGYVFWKDIIDINEQNVQAGLAKQKFIAIIVNNPEEYIARQQSVFKQKNMRMNLKYSGTPIVISINTLNIDFKDLINIMIIKWEDYKKV